MLHAACYALVFKSLALVSCHDSGKKRILGKIFRLSATEWIAVNVHRRCKDHLHIILLCLLRDHSSHFICYFRIPGGAYKGTCRHTDIWLINVHAVITICNRIIRDISSFQSVYTSCHADILHAPAGTCTYRKPCKFFYGPAVYFRIVKLLPVRDRHPLSFISKSVCPFCDSA